MKKNKPLSFESIEEHKTYVSKVSGYTYNIVYKGSDYLVAEVKTSRIGRSIPMTFGCHFKAVFNNWELTKETLH